MSEAWSTLAFFASVYFSNAICSVEEQRAAVFVFGTRAMRRAPLDKAGETWQGLGMSRASDAKERFRSTLAFVRSHDPLVVEAMADVDLTLLALALERTPQERLSSATNASRALARLHELKRDAPAPGKPRDAVQRPFQARSASMSREPKSGM
jgi:hypothetical protein